MCAHLRRCQFCVREAIAMPIRDDDSARTDNPANSGMQPSNTQLVAMLTILHAVHPAGKLSSKALGYGIKYLDS